jgi:hypothetical protein
MEMKYFDCEVGEDFCMCVQLSVFLVKRLNSKICTSRSAEINEDRRKTESVSSSTEQNNFLKRF